jgi:CheY-like chemotaxis protein
MTKHIFLAEDNAADVWLIEEALRRQSITFEIENFTTAAEAIEAVGKCGTPEMPAPDLMVLDYNLPGGHGGEILEAAAQNPRIAAIPKAILTSYLQPSEMQAALELGAACIITKPAGLEQFMTEVGGKLSALLRGDAGQSVPGIRGAAEQAHNGGL